ncbi:MATE family efflux transporter [Arsenicitalea aurantiaca]|uniref:Multidrug-efflux transporter n=2 Tax=Arsenicitalea aurantiaca TaxID=1783274 RepID=A0A433XMB4_9HYPH|nr:MATE family efflux transporter [Arsenicitalea aurantiaca]
MRDWQGEMRALLGLGWPLVVAQLAQNALFTTDVIMMGWLGPTQLAAGTLASSFLIVFQLFGVGIVSAVAPMAAQARGAREFRSVRRTVRQGFWASILLGLLMVPVLLQVGPILLFLGQEAELAALAQVYVNFAAWLFFPAFGIVVLRSFLSAHDVTRIILVITLVGVLVNAGLNYVLMFGNFGFPRLELAGAGIATTLVNIVMMGLMLAYALTHKRLRRYHILVRFWKPDWPRFIEIFRIGAPIGLMLAAEVGMFSVAAVMMGWIGTEAVAAHAIASQCASLAFMVPLGLSHATTVRVGVAYGRSHRRGIALAGWTALAVTLGFMSMTAIAFVVLPEQFVGFFLDAAQPGNVETLALAASFLGVAAVFQLVDGAQVSAAAALRGLSDTRTPMLIALLGYWAVGLPVGYLCGFTLGLGGLGIWFGLATGLALVAVILNIRFAMRERLGLLRAHPV